MEFSGIVLLDELVSVGNALEATKKKMPKTKYLNNRSTITVIPNDCHYTVKTWMMEHKVSRYLEFIGRVCTNIDYEEFWDSLNYLNFCESVYFSKHHKTHVSRKFTPIGESSDYFKNLQDLGMRKTAVETTRMSETCAYCLQRYIRRYKSSSERENIKTGKFLVWKNRHVDDPKVFWAEEEDKPTTLYKINLGEELSIIPVPYDFPTYHTFLRSYLPVMNTVTVDLDEIIELMINTRKEIWNMTKLLMLYYNKICLIFPGMIWIICPGKKGFRKLELGYLLSKTDGPHRFYYDRQYKMKKYTGEKEIVLGKRLSELNHSLIDYVTV
ncbi:hypothetical protein AL387_gp156 [Salmon gill poxvirus]|uniref:Uncharacterized protein n=1 Tax=Salmon gill poxvirus TaxID=1680908 RepID=A0A0H4Y197_9POXV|nr:hypothetical protein AL387_gp156 [Salmon gill poxvirus]AKR04280.1 hypothetical protein SGPV156 [Salmon gill poxvirus]WMX26562.1 hypothetical protein [Salmon gill poxvirus]